MKILMLLWCVLLMCSCEPDIDYIAINGSDEHGQEIAYLESLIQENGELAAVKLSLLPQDTGQGSKEIQPSLYIDILSSWEFEGNYGEHIISRSFYAPRINSLAARTNTSLEACLDGSENIVPVDEITPPYLALRVNSLALGDDAYPLVRVVGITLRAAETNESGRQLNNKRLLSKEFIGKTLVLTKVLEDSPKPLLRPMPQPLWIASGGDLMLDRGASDILFREGPKGIFGETAKMLASADLTLLNLEGVISNRGERVPKSFNFRFVPRVAEALKGAGVDAVLHANNHVFDFGETAFLDSLSYLKDADIGIVGAGHDDDEASAPFVFRRGNEVCRVFGIASFPRERNGWDGVSAAAGPGRPGMLHSGRGGKEKLIGHLSSEKDTLDIVLFHGGVEWSTRPDAATRTLYTDLVAAGADLVIGSHPHIVQGFEWVNNKPVFWSLGNYVFGGMENTEGGEEGLFIHLGFLDNRLLYLEPYALILTHTRTNVAPPENLRTFYNRSRALPGHAPGG